MNNRALEVAKLYYDMGCSQEEIAGKLEITQPQVSKLLKEAKKLGIIREIVSVPLASTQADEIMQRYPNLKECLVIEYMSDLSKVGNYIILDELGKLGADHFRRHVKSYSAVALSGGTTLGKMVEHLSTAFGIRALKVYCTSIWCGDQIYELSPISTVWNMINKFPESSAYCSQPPAFSRNVEEASKAKEVYSKTTEQLLKGALNTQVIYVGLGDIPASLEGEIQRTERRDFAQVLRDAAINKELLKKMAGECSFWPYDINGKILTPPEDDVDGGLERLKIRFIGIELTELSRIVEENSSVICAIAGGPHKRRSVLGGLRAKIFNHLITDMSCAEYAIKNS
jgi:DNA-binding transcriptional regulator LsrR (DeoR family)